jgi:hypothetical protein
MYMKQWMSALLLTVLQGQLQGWGQSMEKEFRQEDPIPQPIFLLNEKQEWFVENSYLLMKPTLENLDFANSVEEHLLSATHSELDTKIKKPDFSWNSGVRLIIGRYLPHHDHWDISAAMTYFYGDVSQKFHANPEHGKGLTPTYGPVNNFVYVATDHLKAHWDLNYFSWDLALGREVAMTRTIVFHPFIALRALLTYQDYTLKSERTYKGFFDTHPHFSTFKFKAENRFWGVGPRLGSHLSYYLKSQWSILGELSAAAVYGPYKNHITDTSFTPETSIRPLRKAKDKTVWLRGNLEGFIGLGWEAWARNKTVRIFPQLLFEGTLWWDMNRYFEPPTSFSESHGALALMGVSFNLQVDF